MIRVVTTDPSRYDSYRNTPDRARGRVRPLPNSALRSDRADAHRPRGVVSAPEGATARQCIDALSQWRCADGDERNPSLRRVAGWRRGIFQENMPPRRRCAPALPRAPSAVHWHSVLYWHNVLYWYGVLYFGFSRTAGLPVAVGNARWRGQRW